MIAGRMSRAGRAWNIFHAMQESDYKAHTVNSIAKLIGIKPSTYLRELLGQMAYSHMVFVKSEYNDDGTVAKRWYALNYDDLPQNLLIPFEEES